MNSLPAELTLSPLHYRHHPQVAALHLLGWQQAYAPIFGKEALQQLSLPAFEQLWQERLALTDRHYLGLWQQRELLGFTGWGPAEERPGAAEIYHFYFHPNSWGRGLASPFMQQLLANIAAAGHQHVQLWVLEANERARKFYAKWGFSPNGRRQERSRYKLLLKEVELQRTLS